MRILFIITVFMLMVSGASSNRLGNQKIFKASHPHPIHLKLDSINKIVLELEILVKDL
ncbi:hypothetical protein SAMN05421820_103294 [Pedobacter steynii]|uniref:Uncharacterized protein n=1 Tax=Pedobacter steynii TaxID=430522 RepID=A0A1G9RN68_9SPHI|nr:hypothetical protein SAMN05421820_103294 [Pedobacter steynii]